MKQSLAILAIIIAAAQPTQGQVRDMLWKRGEKKMISGEITSVTPESLSFKSGGRTQTISVGDLDRLRFGDAPSGLTAVRAAYRNGQLKQAKTQLAAVNQSGRPFVQQELAYFKAVITAKLALSGKGNVEAAAREVGGFLKSNSDSFRYYEACEVMGDLAMSLERFQPAIKYYEKLANSQSPNFAARGALLLGDIWLLKDDKAKAGNMFARASQSADSRISAMGELGVALALCTSKQGAIKAIPAIEKVIAENDSSDVELFARAYNSLGQAFLAAAQNEAALDAFLHTDLLFYRATDRHAEALFHLSKLWMTVNKPAEATKARQTLKQRYASSMWAKR